MPSSTLLIAVLIIYIYRSKRFYFFSCQVLVFGYLCFYCSPECLPSVFAAVNVSMVYCCSGYDCWGSVAELATILLGIGASDVPLVPAPHSPTEGLIPLVLEEDRLLKGFEPLLSSQQIPPMYTTDPTAVVSEIS